MEREQHLPRGVSACASQLCKPQKTPKPPPPPPSRSLLGGGAVGLCPKQHAPPWANPPMPQPRTALSLPATRFQPDYLLILSPTSFRSASLPLPACPRCGVLLSLCLPHPGLSPHRVPCQRWPARSLHVERSSIRQQMKNMPFSEENGNTEERRKKKKKRNLNLNYDFAQAHEQNSFLLLLTLLPRSNQLRPAPRGRCPDLSCRDPGSPGIPHLQREDPWDSQTCRDHIFHGEKTETFSQPVPSQQTCQQEVPVPTNPPAEPPHAGGARQPYPPAHRPHWYQLQPPASDHPRQGSASAIEVLIPQGQDGRLQSVLGAEAEPSAIATSTSIASQLIINSNNTNNISISQCGVCYQRLITWLWRSAPGETSLCQEHGSPLAGEVMESGQSNGELQTEKAKPETFPCQSLAPGPAFPWAEGSPNIMGRPAFVPTSGQAAGTHPAPVGLQRDPPSMLRLRFRTMTRSPCSTFVFVYSILDFVLFSVIPANPIGAGK